MTLSQLTAVLQLCTGSRTYRTVQQSSSSNVDHTCHQSWTAEKETVASSEAPVGSLIIECGRFAGRSSV